MAYRTKAFVAAGCVVLAGLGAAMIGAGSQPTGAAPAKEGAVSADAYKIDSVHSSVIFRIRHMGVANFYGRFDSIAGTFAYDAGKPEGAQVDASIKVDSVHTGAGGRDSKIKTAQYFNAEKFSTITFKSTGAKSDGGKTTITGDLTMMGVTKPVTATVTDSATKGNAAGLEAVFTVKRSDFGMTANVADGSLGDEVQITVALEGMKK